MQERCASSYFISFSTQFSATKMHRSSLSHQYFWSWSFSQQCALQTTCPSANLCHSTNSNYSLKNKLCNSNTVSLIFIAIYNAHLQGAAKSSPPTKISPPKAFCCFSLSWNFNVKFYSFI